MVASRINPEMFDIGIPPIRSILRHTGVRRYSMIVRFLEAARRR